MNKKLFYLTSVFLSLSIMIVVGCSKLGNIDDLMELEENLNEQRVLTNKQIELIGEMHNDFLTDTFKNIEWNTFHNKESFQNSIDTTLKSVKLDSDSISARNFETNVEIIKKGLQKEENFKYFEKVISFLNQEQKDINTIILFLDSVNKEAEEKMHSVKDYEAFLIFTTVTKYSAQFWLPKSIGAEGNFEKFKLAEYGAKNRTTSKGWKACMSDVLEADGTSAAAGFIIGAGAAAASGPVAPATFIAVIAAESGVASGWAYYRSVNC